MAWGRRCELGCASWPDQALYEMCPICEDSTRRYKNLAPLDESEASSIKLHHEFEKFYVRRCSHLGVPVDGPLPEAPRKQLGPGPGRAAGGGSGGGAASAVQPASGRRL